MVCLKDNHNILFYKSILKAYFSKKFLTVFQLKLKFKQFKNRKIIALSQFDRKQFKDNDCDFRKRQFKLF